MQLLRQAVFENPYDTYRHLREADPVAWSDELNGWLVTRWDDVVDALKHHEVFSSRRIGLLAARGGAEIGPEMRWLIDMASQWMWMLDPPEHTRVRKLMNQGFSPRDVRSFATTIEEIAGQLIADVAAKPRADLVTQLSYRMPTLMLCRLYGLSDEDAPRLTAWADALKLFLGGSKNMTETHAPAYQSLKEMMAYLDGIIDERRNQPPAANLISRLVYAEWEGQRLSHEELCSNLLLLLAATFETSIDLLSNGVLALLRSRDQWDLLRLRPELAGNAVDELLRYDGPVQVTHRIAATDIEIRGKHIKAGQLVYLVRGSANRDPNKFPDPDTVDITRDASGHVALGHGVHYCIGAHLAKTEGTAALRALVDTLPSLRLDDKVPPSWRADNLQFRGLRTLPVITGTAG